MDFGIISLVVSVVVACITALRYLESRTERKEQENTKFARTEGVSLETIRADIAANAEKLDDHSEKISTLQTQAAVCINQHSAVASNMNNHLRAIERLGEKLEKL